MPYHAYPYFFPVQISAEEIKDNRVVNFEMEARKLDKKVHATQSESIFETKVLKVLIVVLKFLLFYAGSLWKVRPLP